MIIIKNIFKICFVIIGTIIGAGFASGKEIYTFFCIYGIYGFFGLILSNLIIGIVIFFTFSIIKNNNVKTYSQFIESLVGKNKILNYSINNIMNIFLLISFIIMVTGFSAYLMQELNVPLIYGALIISILSFLTFSKNINAILKINSFIIPFLIILIIFLAYKENVLFFNFNNLNISYNKLWIIKSILYASYNSIILVPILVNLGSLITNKKQIKYITLITEFIIIICSIIIYIVLCTNISKISLIDIPIVYIANSFRIYL